MLHASSCSLTQAIASTGLFGVSGTGGMTSVGGSSGLLLFATSLRSFLFLHFCFLSPFFFLHFFLSLSELSSLPFVLHFFFFSFLHSSLLLSLLLPMSAAWT